MIIKFKNIPVIDPSDPLQKHLESVLSPSNNVYAKKKLEVACNAAMLIKKNNDALKKDVKNSNLLETNESKDELKVLLTITDNAESFKLKSQQQPQSLTEHLSKQAELRKENQLVYGRSPRNANLISLGLGLAENHNKSDGVVYKKKLLSTVSYIYPNNQYGIHGTVEFGITYDNEIFILPKPNSETACNLYNIAQGVFLKAAGCIQIGTRKIEESKVERDTYPELLEGQVNYISIYNSFFDVPEDNIAVSLFALKQLGIDLRDTQVVIPNDEAPLISRDSDCNINMRSNMKNASYYLDEIRFPGAKALAEKRLNFFDKIVDLFCTIDDEVFLKRDKKIIKKTYEEKELLKLNLVKLFNCTAGLIKDTEKNSKRVKTELDLFNATNQSSSLFSLQTIAKEDFASTTTVKAATIDTVNECWQAIKTSIQFFKEKNVDLRFLTFEINMILAYLLQNSLPSEEKNQLQELLVTARMPGRELDVDSISNYIKFYERDPIKTCMVLLKDYTKGMGCQGMIHRFFSGAWKRNYKDVVNKFLSIYPQNKLPDNMTICGIYDTLKNLGLLFNVDAESKSSLIKILLFCAKLNNEEESLLNLLVNRSLTSVFSP